MKLLGDIILMGVLVLTSVKVSIWRYRMMRPPTITPDMFARIVAGTGGWPHDGHTVIDGTVVESTEVPL